MVVVSTLLVVFPSLSFELVRVGVGDVCIVLGLVFGYLDVVSDVGTGMWSVIWVQVCGQ